MCKAGWKCSLSSQGTMDPMTKEGVGMVNI